MTVAYVEYTQSHKLRMEFRPIMSWQHTKRLKSFKTARDDTFRSDGAMVARSPPKTEALGSSPSPIGSFSYFSPFFLRLFVITESKSHMILNLRNPTSTNQKLFPTTLLSCFPSPRPPTKPHHCSIHLVKMPLSSVISDIYNSLTFSAVHAESPPAEPTEPTQAEATSEKGDGEATPKESAAEPEVEEPEKEGKAEEEEAEEEEEEEEAKDLMPELTEGTFSALSEGTRSRGTWYP